MAGVYIHIPYCGKLCSYCDFHFSVSIKDKKEMIDSIIKEIELRKDFFESNFIDTIYFGGGTPSYCSVDDISLIINKLSNYIDLSIVKEFSFESNPEDLTIDFLSGIKALGINRLSIGIQSFDDKVLKFFNRRHDSKKAIESVRNAQKCGFSNITIDLIYGVNGFDFSSWKNSVDNALKLNIQHISAYHLTIDKGSVLGHKLSKGEISLIDEIEGQKQFDYLHTSLEKAGFNHYEVSNFALFGRESLHNSNYWKGIQYVGLGPSAHSFFGSYREWNISNNRRYIESVKQGVINSEKEQLTVNDRYNEYVMISLRTIRGVDIDYIRQNFPTYLYDYFVMQAQNNKIINNNKNNYFIASKDFLLSDSVITDFIYTN